MSSARRLLCIWRRSRSPLTACIGSPWDIVATSIPATNRMDGYCLPLSQYSRTLRFPACGGHSRHDRLCRSDVDLCHGNSDALVLVGFGWPSCRPVPVRDWHLATVLYVCHHGKPSARSQSVDIAATRVTNSPEAQSVRHASEEARRDHVAVANQADKHTLRHPPESRSQLSQRQPAAARKRPSPFINRASSRQLPFPFIL